MRDRLELERAERARIQAEMEATKNQLAPHFLFNCLNALGVLIRENPPAALSYNQHMASIYRYLLVQQRRDLVPLSDELEFFADYAALVRLRHPEGVRIDLLGFDPGAVRGLLIPPASLQQLLENALKHNRFDLERPLAVRVRLAGREVEVVNSLRPLSTAVASTGTGLANLRERFRIVVGRPIQVARDAGEFRVRLPLVRAAGN
jgi:LytS/YehU family sensor histidine kinase